MASDHKGMGGICPECCSALGTGSRVNRQILVFLPFYLFTYDQADTIGVFLYCSHKLGQFSLYLRCISYCKAIFHL